MGFCELLCLASCMRCTRCAERPMRCTWAPRTVAPELGHILTSKSRTLDCLSTSRAAFPIASGAARGFDALPHPNALSPLLAAPLLRRIILGGQVARFWATWPYRGGVYNLRSRRCDTFGQTSCAKCRRLMRRPRASRKVAVRSIRFTSKSRSFRL
jgi:hypothetical protein